MSDWNSQWKSSGLIHISGALNSETTKRLLQRIDTLHTDYINGKIENFSIGAETAKVMPALWSRLLSSPRELQTFKKWNLLALDNSFIELIDIEPIFSKILSIMGVNIQIFRSLIIAVPPNVSEPDYLHTDSGTLGHCFADPRFPPLMLSVQYFLTDLIEANCGNFTYVPGTQHTPFPKEDGNPQGDQTSGFVQGQGIDGRVQICAKAGDAIIFPHSLWHGASGNTSATARKSIIIGYCQNFIRPYDYVEQNAQTLAACHSDRQRRLLGDLGDWAWRPGCQHHQAPGHADLITAGSGTYENINNLPA